jgi:hypothetical protein
MEADDAGVKSHLFNGFSQAFIGQRIKAFIILPAQH